MVLVLLTFGERLENHYQASFAILSYLKSQKITDVCVVTDRPEFYSYFGDRIKIIAIDDKIMQEWRGEHDFFWRIKMKGIEAAALQHPQQDVLYVDSDTIYVEKIDSLKTQLDSGASFMHELEGTLTSIPSSTTRKMWQSLQGKKFGNQTIDTKTEMWNAGVIAIPATHAVDTIQYAIQLCDEMCATDCTRRLIEQFAFSMALKEKHGLVAAEEIVAHYWGNKPGWNNIIVEFFMRSTLCGYSLDEDLERFNAQEFIKQPTVLREKSTKEKLQNALNKLMKPKDIRFFNQK